MRSPASFFEQVLNVINTDIAVFDTDLRYEYVNPVAVKDPAMRAWMIGKTDEEYIRYRGRDPQIAVQRGRILHEALQTGRPVESTEVLVTATGEERHFIRRACPVTSADGRVEGLIGYGFDVTDLRRADSALRQSESSLRAFIDNAPYGVFHSTLDQRFTLVNTALVRILGYSSKAELLLTDISRDVYVDGSVASRVPADQHHTLDVRMQWRRKDGQHIKVRVTGRRLVDAAGAMQGWECFVEDVTRLESAEEELRTSLAYAKQLAKKLELRVAFRTAELSLANAELSRMMRSKDDFLSAMSHELRTPLTAILGLSESLAEGVYGDMTNKQVHSINTIAESGHYLLSLINDLLDIAKIGAGKLELELSTTSVEEVCQASVRFVLPEARKRNIDLTLVMDDQSVLITVDARRLKQILVNLLSNAVKFTPDGGSVTLETKYDLESESLTVSVRDTGIGIAAEDLKRLFRPFTQLDAKLSRHYAGTGLGLTLVMELVELHGGSVAVESELGKGSCFTIRIPCKVLDTLSPHNPSGAISLTEVLPADTLPPHTLLILVADDNEVNLMTLTDSLHAHNFRVIHARDGVEAVKQVHARTPSLVLMDIQMPVMDGLEAIAHLRADDRYVAMPIIALTSRAMVGDGERCIAAGANEYLSKPVNLKQLTKTIRALLLNDNAL